MEWKLFADLAEIAGERSVSVDVEGGTVEDALDALFEVHPGLRERVLSSDGSVRGHLNVLRNGTDVATEEGLSSPVEAADELALFPPVSGGRERT